MATELVNPLVVIVGPTASGKTSLAINLAKQFNGEVICADSRTVYKGMDIGTAKPTVPEMDGIPHHLLDVVNPDQLFSVADFKRLAQEAIDDISFRGKLPIMVGGSGLYIDSILYDYKFRPANSDTREKFKDASVEELQAELTARGIALPENSSNQRYLLRSLEAGQQSDIHNKLRENTLIIGMQIDPEILKSRIASRVEDMVNNGLVDEVKMLSGKYGWDIPPMQASAYKCLKGLIEGTQTIEQVKAEIVALDGKLAKKQRTWFKRNNSIHWVSDPSKSVDLVTTFLNT